VFVAPVTVAENCCCAPTLTWALAGDTATATWPEVMMVTWAEPYSAGLASDVADTVTIARLGAVAGAVYNPVEVMLPHSIPEHPAPVALHITTPLPGPLAANCIFAPGATVGKVGVTVMPD
jgi:hypothetical protein